MSWTCSGLLFLFDFTKNNIRSFCFQTGEMEVRNPLFTEPDSSLLSSPTGSYPPSNANFPQLTTSPTKEKSIP